MTDRSNPSASAIGLPDDGRGTVVTVGTFDGVHRGHWAVLSEIRSRAQATGRRAVLVTFEPHPLRVVRPEAAPSLLTTAAEKKEILAQSGLDYAVFLKFTPELSRYSPRRFVEEILVAGLRVEELVIGYDHGFGRGRSGDAETLGMIGKELGFDVDVVGPIRFDGVAVSSSEIRKAVRSGELERARAALGRPYSLRGSVVAGEGRGRELGVPTANLRIGGADKLVPTAGIYAVVATTRRGTFPGALHIGPRPTFEGASPSIEVHLIDYGGPDLYGEEVRLDLIRYLRPVIGFETVAELVTTMNRDIVEAKQVLAAESGLFEQGERNNLKG